MENQQPATADEKKKQQAIKNLLALVVKEANSGKTSVEISAKLTGMGMSAEEAPKFVDAAMVKLQQQAEQEKPVPGSMAPAVIGAVLAAVLAGLGWGWLAKLTNMEYGYAAIAVGALCAGAVLLFTRGKKGMPLQIIAGACSLLGIFIGKYSIFILQITDYLAKNNNGQKVEVNPFSAKAFGVFLENINSLVGRYDVLWIILAVWTAWRMLTPAVRKTIVR
jgi:hypothetical protein